MALMKNCPLIRLATSEPSDQSSHHRRGTARPVCLPGGQSEAQGPSSEPELDHLITSLQGIKDKGGLNDLTGMQLTQPKMWEILQSRDSIYPINKWQGGNEGI